MNMKEQLTKYAYADGLSPIQHKSVMLPLRWVSARKM